MAGRLDPTHHFMVTLERHGKKIEELMKRVKELEALLNEQPVKRGPGRPPKAVEAA